MADEVEVRESAPDDIAAIEALYPQAFPDEDLLPLVTRLLEIGPEVHSLVATEGASVIGHVIFTICGVAGHPEQTALLAPLGVAPARQGRGVGSALVRAGVTRMEAAGISCVYVLGDPNYYSRFGFEQESDVAPPYALPEEWRSAWQSLSVDLPKRPLRGPLSLPEPWLQPALWTP